MEPLRIRKKPEKEIQDKIIHKLRLRGWVVFTMFASENLRGFPDLYCTHKRYGYRWVEVKLPGMVGSKFTPAQLEVFPKLIANGTHIWILTSDTDKELDLLFKPMNLSSYLILHS